MYGRTSSTLNSVARNICTYTNGLRTLHGTQSVNKSIRQTLASLSETFVSFACEYTMYSTGLKKEQTIQRGRQRQLNKELIDFSNTKEKQTYTPYRISQCYLVFHVIRVRACLRTHR